MSFSLDLSKFANLTDNKMEKVVIKSFLGLTTDITKGIPVDEGRARNSFFPAINKFSEELPNEDDKSGNKSKARVIRESNKYKLGDMLSFTSNLSYIVSLEKGHSNQAPTGFVELNVIRWQTYIDEQTRKLK